MYSPLTGNFGNSEGKVNWIGNSREELNFPKLRITVEPGNPVTTVPPEIPLNAVPFVNGNFRNSLPDWKASKHSDEHTEK